VKGNGIYACMEYILWILRLHEKPKKWVGMKEEQEKMFRVEVKNEVLCCKTREEKKFIGPF